MSGLPQNPNPSVSVVITAYNSGDFIDTAIASAYDQTVTPSQVIVVNDGSTDDTEGRLQRLASTLPPSFIWKTKPNGGVASALNEGTRVATCEYVAYLDHDDTWHPRKLERQLEHFRSVPDLALSFTGYTCTNAAYNHTPGQMEYGAIHHEHWNADPDVVLERLLTGRLPVGPMSTVMIRRDVLTCLPPFDERLRVASDVCMYLELEARRLKMDYLAEPLVNYRWHGTNISGGVDRVWEDLCDIYERFWEEHARRLPRQLRAHAPRWLAHTHLQTAIDAIRHGDKPRARRHILKAARTRPLSIRPGWVRMLGIGSPPVGPWRE